MFKILKSEGLSRIACGRWAWLPLAWARLALPGPAPLLLLAGLAALGPRPQGLRGPGATLGEHLGWEEWGGWRVEGGGRWGEVVGGGGATQPAMAHL